MKSKMAGLIIGGLITVSALGVAFGANSISNAAAETEQATVLIITLTTQIGSTLHSRLTEVFSGVYIDGLPSIV